MNKRGKQKGNWVELIFSLIIGFLLFTSIPEIKSYFDKLVNAIFTGIIGAIIIGGIIFVGWYIMKKNRY